MTAAERPQDKEIDNLLQLTAGEPITLVVSARGYKDKSVTIDGRDPKPLVTLDAVRSSGGGHTTSAAPPPPPPAGHSVGGFDDPWVKK